MHPVVQSVCGLHLVLSYVSYSEPPPTRGSAFRKGGKNKTRTHAHTIDCISTVKKNSGIFTLGHLHPILDAALMKPPEASAVSRAAGGSRRVAEELQSAVFAD